MPVRRVAFGTSGHHGSAFVKDFKELEVMFTPLHNPPEDGVSKYFPPNSGLAGVGINGWTEAKANELLVSCGALEILHSVCGTPIRG